MAYVQSILTNKPSYIDGGSYAAVFDRRPLADLIGPGVVGASDLLVTWVTGRTVQIAAGAAYVSGQNVSYQGNYHCYIPASVQLIHTASDPSNPRIDTVIVRALDNASDSSTFTEGRLEIVPGTPTTGATLVNLSGKANLTTLTDASKSVLVLAYVLMPAGAVNLDATKISDVRTRSMIGSGAALLSVPRITTSPLAGGPPASPLNNDIWIATSVDANGTRWTFQYNAGSASAYKWEFIGGAPLISRVNATESTTNNSYADLATTGPGFTLARAGDYNVRATVSAGANGATDVFMAIAVNSTPGNELRLQVSNASSNNADSGIMLTDITMTQGANTALRIMYKILNNSFTAYYQTRVLTATPVRIA